jgi:hypothetical protein
LQQASQRQDDQTGELQKLSQAAHEVPVQDG